MAKYHSPPGVFAHGFHGVTLGMESRRDTDGPSGQGREARH